MFSAAWVVFDLFQCCFICLQEKGNEAIIIRGWFLIPMAVIRGQLSFIWADFPQAFHPNVNLGPQMMLSWSLT